jgi:hypothetical protein
MAKPDNTVVERFEKEIVCPICNSGKAELRAWADLNGLDRMEVESIAELSIEDIRRLASYGEGGIEGKCTPCAKAVPASGRLAELGGISSSMPEPRRRRRASVQ